ncbi:MAG: tetratricopeptide repeat protein [Aquaticitalea sp.]
MTKEELVSGYFSNTLTSEEHRLLEDFLANDLEFKDAFLFEQNLKKAIGQHEKKELKAQLQDYESRRVHEKKGSDTESKPSNFKLYSIAAAVLLFLTAGWFAYNTVYGVNFQELYNENYQDYPNTVYQITRSDSDDTLERQAFVAYESENYRQAIDLFEKNPNSDYTDFYLAQSYAHLDDSGKARQLYKKIIAEDAQFTAEAHWYLALLYLKEENKSDAKTYLTQLVTNHAYNKEKAQRILKRLD